LHRRAACRLASARPIELRDGGQEAIGIGA
jgi:hypothetical protein